MKKTKLKWVHWLFILATIMLLSPIAIYAYSVLIFGGSNWSDEQIKIAGNMGFLWTLFLMLVVVEDVVQRLGVER